MSELTIDGLEPTEKVARLQDRIDVLERERDALWAALRETAGVLSDYVNDEDPTLLRARAALEAKP